MKLCSEINLSTLLETEGTIQRKQAVKTKRGFGTGVSVWFMVFQLRLLSSGLRVYADEKVGGGGVETDRVVLISKFLPLIALRPWQVGLGV